MQETTDVHPPWHHAPEIERELSASYTAQAASPIVFKRDGDARIRAARLFLFLHDDRYDLGNIVPCDGGPDLEPPGYNDILNDFVERVVEPATRSTTCSHQTTKRHRTITDWTSSDAASALHQFSVAANKSTGASHPDDAARWYAFLIADHRAKQTWNHSDFERWLVEVEHWPLDEAQELALQRERARELLDKYDRAAKSA